MDLIEDVLIIIFSKSALFDIVKFKFICRRWKQIIYDNYEQKIEIKHDMSKPTLLAHINDKFDKFSFKILIRDYVKRIPVHICSEESCLYLKISKGKLKLSDNNRILFSIETKNRELTIYKILSDFHKMI